MSDQRDPNLDPGIEAPPQSQPVEPQTPPVETQTPPEPPIEPQAPQQSKTDWRDRRIGELTQRTKELREENARLKAVQQSSTDPGRDPAGRFQQPAGYQGPPSQEAINAQIEERAALKAANNEFNRRCDEVADIGRKTYADFDKQVQNLVSLVDPNDPQRLLAYNEFLQSALETVEASRIIHSLGGDLDEASRILSLPPRRMLVELTRMAAKPVQELSQTPRPINPAPTNAMGQRTSGSPDDPSSDNMSIEEWMRKRTEQVTARNVRR